MIEYVEIRSKDTRQISGLIDSAKSIIWHSVYYGVGDFEIYAQANDTNIELLQIDNYVTRPDNDEIGIIEKIETTDDPESGKMIIASGRFAKSILDRRHIYKISGHVNTPTILSGNVETAIRTVVTNNIINCTFDTNRNISFLELGASAGTTKTIVDGDGNATQKQVSYENLLEYTEEVLKEYGLSSKIIIDDESYKLQYKVFEGADRSASNTAENEPVIFSQEYDNLTKSNFSKDLTPQKTSAIIGGEGEGLERFYSVVDGSATGINRRETWVDASSLNKKYEDSEGAEQTYTDAEYTKMLNSLAKQELAYLAAEIDYSGTVATNGMWNLNEDYFLGDLVTFQDNNLGVYANVRLIEITEVQDEDGYTITPEFEFANED